MVLPLAGTMSVTNGQPGFIWTGAPLTRLNCVPGATVIVGGVAYFIGAEPTDTTHGSFSRTYAGATAGSVAADISQLSPDQVRTGELNKRAADLFAELSVVEANGRGLFYRFSDATADADPGAGYLRVNHATITSSTAGYLDSLDANGATVAGELDTWDDSTSDTRGKLWLRSIADPSAFRVFKITGSVVDGGGYRKLTWSHLGGSGAFAAEDELMVFFVPTGDRGDSYVTDAQVANPAGLAAYIGQPVGYRVFVTDLQTTFGAYSGRSGAVRRIAGPAWELVAIYTGAQGAASTVPGPTGPSGINWRGAHNIATAYLLNDGVTFNKSSFRRLVAGTGNAPSSASPPVDNTWWAVVAAKGTDGAGTGDIVGPAAAVADRVAVFDGLTGKLIKDGGKTIAELVPAGYDDLVLTVSQIALQVADNANAALFLGPTGNRYADSFDALSFVDVAGATNLDTSTAGVLKPSLGAATLISGATGTNIGDLTSGGGLAAIFDGTTSQGLGASGTRTSFQSGFAGKNYSSAPKKIDSAKTYGSNDTGYIGGGVASSATLYLYAKNGSAPSSYSDGTLLGSVAITDLETIDSKTINSSDKTTAWDYVWVAVLLNAASSSNIIVVAELQFYAPGTTNNMTVFLGPFTAAASVNAIKALTRVREVDAAVAGTDYTIRGSADNKANWAAIALTELYSAPSPSGALRIVNGAAADTSTHPGTTIWLELKTLNAKMVEFHDVYSYWS